ncbi:hypothetical protein LOK49_LG02G00897 [Camellia lanceoleosa]|uniref:Uncharacterized protein n=1 Tax=Camellia lanceoleosa TaxID=1840588 RepID=A0ACC0IP39_9ERIC|nr:hypothetical protein LOK49_LG02G00897 [Camellia lanceoleosa]
MMLDPLNRNAAATKPIQPLSTPLQPPSVHYFQCEPTAVHDILILVKVWKWLTDQEQPPKTINTNPVRQIIFFSKIIMLELLNQLDGFDSRGDVKVILATNKIESLDPALLRPGRIDRKIEFPLPDIKTRRRIFQIHTSRMTLADDVNLEEFVMTKDEFSGADIKAICTEAGLLALRERRMKVTHSDFKKAKDKVMFKKKEGCQKDSICENTLLSIHIGICFACF